jgi:hypothetical protein
VEQTGVHEHGSEQCREIGARIGKEAAWNERPLHYESIAAAELHNKKEHIQRDQYVRNYRCSSSRAVVITGWKHGFLLLNFNGVRTRST